MTQLKHFIILLISITIVGCASSPDSETDRLNEAELHKAAKSAMKRGEFDRAINRLEALEARYPFGEYALQGQLDLMYGYYRSQRPDEAISAANRFLRLNPTHPSRDYVYYIKGVTEFERNDSLLDKWFPRDPADYEQQTLFSAYYDFEKLIKKFPNSIYAADARQRMIYLRNKLAESCVKQAEWYKLRGAHVAQVNSAQGCITQFNGAPALSEAQALVKHGYTKLGLDNLTQNY